MFEVTVVHFHTAMQMLSPLINSVVDNGLLHTGPRSNQMRVRYTNKYVSKLTKKWVYHSSREINDISNDSRTEQNNFYNSIVLAKCLKCDIRIITLRN